MLGSNFQLYSPGKACLDILTSISVTAYGVVLHILHRTISGSNQSVGYQLHNGAIKSVLHILSVC